MSKEKDPRHNARIVILKKLYARSFYEDAEIKNKNAIIDPEYKIEYDKKLAQKIFRGVLKNESKIDEILNQASITWKTSTMNRVDLLILRIAVYEGFLSKITPPKVAINEAVELAKKFGGNTSPKFVNGVLGAVHKICIKEDQKGDDE